MATDLDEARECAAKDPLRALELENRHIAANPSDPHGYFSRHCTWSQLGEYEKALADCDVSIQLHPLPFRYVMRADVHRALGDYSSALADLNFAYNADLEMWFNSFGPHVRADTFARLGQLDEALADAALIGEDHWMPEHNGLPGGDKQQFIAEIKRRAAAAKRSV